MKAFGIGTNSSPRRDFPGPLSETGGFPSACQSRRFAIGSPGPGRGTGKEDIPEYVPVRESRKARMGQRLG